MKLSVITQFVFVTLLLSLGTMAQAAVFKHVDENGNVIKYSDQPQHPGDQPMSVPPPAMVFDSKPPSTSPSTPSGTEGNKEEETSKSHTAYSAVTFVKPDNDETIRANGGVFPVTIASEPALDAEAGDRYVVLVDGEKHQTSDSASFQLENINRGTHSISVEIVNGDGETLTSSSSITIHVLRTSVSIRH